MKIAQINKIVNTILSVPVTQYKTLSAYIKNNYKVHWYAYLWDSSNDITLHITISSLENKRQFDFSLDLNITSEQYALLKEKSEEIRNYLENTMYNIIINDNGNSNN